jgi:tRNA(fMet)-specific endonuclease VapC
MPFVLDTVICSATLTVRPNSKVFGRMIQHGGQLYVSQITCAELYALGYRSGAKKLAQIDDLLLDLNILEFDDSCAREYGRLHARLAERGQAAGRADLMITATALVHGLTLVTHDSDFGSLTAAIPELQLEDWLV